jgi:transposase-like protein
MGVRPDAAAERDPQGHFTQAFRLAAVRYALGCGQSQRAAARDMGLSDKTLSMWINEARPDQAGIVDGPRFDELAQLRTQNRELLARNQHLTAERDFLKKCATYFATPARGGSK